MNPSEHNPSAQAEGPPPDYAFEQALRRAMRPIEPSPAFADRVITLAARRRASPARLFSMPIGGRWYIGAIAAALLVGYIAAGAVHMRHQRQARARAQFALAIRITNRTLEQTRERLGRAGIEFRD